MLCSACVSTELWAVLFHMPASGCGSIDGLTETGSDELVTSSNEMWAEGGGWLNLDSAGRSEGRLTGVLDGATEGVSGGSCDEELNVMLEDMLEGVNEGESESVFGRGSDGESAGKLDGVGRGICSGVGSCGSVHTGCPSATYHTSLCLFSSFKGLHTNTRTHTHKERATEQWTQVSYM